MKQTEWAFLLPPVLRTKSRYLNLGELLRWAHRTRWLLTHRPPDLVRLGDRERLEARLGWLTSEALPLAEWLRWYRLVARAEQAVRNRWLYPDADLALAARLAPVVATPRDAHLAAELVAHVREQCAGLRPGETIPGSTQILESTLGSLKALSKDQSRSGFTSLVLGLGTMFGRLTKDGVRSTLARTPVRAVQRWCAANIGASLQRLRARIYGLPEVIDLG